MHAELNVVCERWQRSRRLTTFRWAASLTPEQTAQLRALEHGQGALISLDGDADYVFVFRGDTLPAMPRWLRLAPPVSMTRWRFARCVMLFGVLLVIIAVLGVRDWLRRG